jgi:predicted small metal-binding protein
MLRVSCRDVATECDFVGRANSEEELMMQILNHIVKDHRSDMEQIMKPEIRNKIKANIRRLTD